MDRLHAMEEYMEAAESLVRSHGVSRNIFFSTDDPSIIEEIESGIYTAANFTFFYTK
jgi:hypothetical protein